MMDRMAEGNGIDMELYRLVFMLLSQIVLIWIVRRGLEGRVRLLRNEKSERGWNSGKAR